MRYARRNSCLIIAVWVFAFWFVQFKAFGQEERPQRVNFCDLVRQPGRFDGHLVRTTATYSVTMNSGVLTDKTCPSTLTEKHVVVISFSKEFDSKGHNAKSLFQSVKKGHSVEVVLVGVIHAAPDQTYGYTDAPSQLETSNIDDLKHDPTP